MGLWLFFSLFAPWWVGGIFFLCGVALVVFVPVVTVFVDRGRGLLVIERLSLTGKVVQEIPTDQIASVYVDQRVSSDEDGTSYTYRVVLVLDNGEEVPLRKSSSSGRKQKVRWADAIREEIGVSGVDEDRLSIREGLEQAFALNPIQDQEEKIGIAPGVQESNGVHWQLETFNYASASQGAPVHRWSSTDIDTPNDFVFIVQKVEGMGEQRGLMKLAGKFLFKTSMQMYGFDESFAPGLQNAKIVENVDKRLAENYFVYTSNPVLARQLLNPWMVMPLVSWSARYELRPRDQEMHQLAVLFSPYGLYVSQLGQLDQAEVDELIALGVELVRAK